MPRFHFRVVDAWGEATDEEGLELPDLDTARRHAIAGARSMMSDCIRSGRLDLGGYIDIADSSGTTLSRVAYRDAVTIED